MALNTVLRSILGTSRAGGQHEVLFLPQIASAGAKDASFSDSIFHKISEHLPFVISKPHCFLNIPSTLEAKYPFKKKRKGWGEVSQDLGTAIVFLKADTSSPHTHLATAPRGALAPTG